MKIWTLWSGSQDKKCEHFQVAFGFIVDLVLCRACHAFAHLVRI